MSKKQTYSHKWDISILEQVAYDSNIASRAKTVGDWDIFLTAIYESIGVLTQEQRIVLILSQEVGLSYVDISRIMGKPLSTVVGLLRQSIKRVCLVIKSRSLADPNRFDCKAMQKLRHRTEQRTHKEPIHEPPEFEFIDKFNGVYIEPTEDDKETK